MYTSQTLVQVSCLRNLAVVRSQCYFQAKEHVESTKHYSHTSVNHLHAIKQSTSNLVNTGIKEVSSGNTPRKRKWQYNDQWTLTKDRDELLQDWNQYQPSTRSKTQDDEQPLNGPPTFAGTENIDSSDLHRDTKSESSDVDVPLPKPLVDSRKRNHALRRRIR